MKPYEIETRVSMTIPDEQHAISVCLPHWSHNIDYEEGKLKLQIGYPRVLLHPRVKELYHGRIIFQNEYAAQICSQYCQKIVSKTFVNDHAIFTVGEKDDDNTRMFWQRSGYGISSRQAEDILNGNVLPLNQDLRRRVELRINKFVKVPNDNIFIFLSGMCAIFTAFKVTEGPYVMLGFPYYDTLKILENYSSCQLVTSFEELENIKNIGTLFIEFPSNPLLNVIDLDKIYQFAKSRNIIVVLDDTINTFYNGDLSPYCDVLVTSLTKSFSGYGNVMAGSLIITKSDPELLDKVQSIYKKADWIYQRDLQVLNDNSLDYEERIEKMNSNSRYFLNWLKLIKNSHSNILKRFYHPEENDAETYSKYSNGCCSLFSIEFQSESLAAKFFDQIHLNKGPSFGNWCTLLCPYTIVAHYFELEWAQKYGVNPALVRVSIGCEDNLLESFQKAWKIFDE
eukprot:NODE_18_length_47517_cov_0.674814.p11 type:complete len:453 gc:universal NODE_18_length_47517_cov_0.674814:26549-27907(+)